MTTRARAELLLFASTFIWGGTFVLVKMGLEDVSPLLLLTIRFGIASLVFLPIALPAFGRLNRGTLQHGLILGALLSVGFIAQTVGMQYTSASKSGFITGLLVVFTPFFQIVIERRVPRLGNIVGVILVVAGLYLLTAPAGSSFNRGDALTLLGAAVFGVYIVYLDVFARRDDYRLLAMIQFLLMLVAAGVGTAFFEESRFVGSTFLYGAIAYLALLATVATLAVQTRYQKDTTPTRAAIIFSLEPVIAAILAYLVLDEVIGTLGILGGGLVVGGLLVSELWERPLVAGPPAEPHPQDSVDMTATNNPKKT